MHIFIRSFLLLLVLLTSSVVAEEVAKTPNSQQDIFPPEVLQEPGVNSEDHFFRDFMNMLASLGLIIIIIFIASWFLKRIVSTRMQQMNQTSEIKILERRSLTPKTSIYLIEIGGKGLALAESTNGITFLGQLNPEKNFSQILEDKLKQDGPTSAQ